MSSRRWCWYTQQVINEDLEMAYKATFFRGEIMQQTTNPVLSFNGVELVPYFQERTERGWNLYYPPGTTTPVDPGAWPRQLERQGWRQVRCGVEPDGSVMVVCERVQS